MARDATATRDKLIRAAEYLFARQGIDVPIREIHAQAGQRNASAIQYHFGGKEELVRAVLDKHAVDPDEFRAIADDLSARRGDPRGFVEAIVRRFCLSLANAETRDYMRFSFHLLIRAPVRRDLVEGLDHPYLTSMRAETELIRAAVPQLPERLVHERAVAGLAFILLQVAERARIIDDGEGQPLLDEEDFIANLVDMASALLTAPARTPATT